MPELSFPTSDLGRVALLTRLHQTATDRLTAGDTTIDAAMRDEIAAFLTTYRPKVETLHTRLGNRMHAVDERNTAREALSIYVRDFCVALKRRVHRLKQPADVLLLYSLHADGLLPNPKTDDELLQWANRLIAGDAQAVTAGYPAMSNPSATELQTVLDAARTEMAAVPQADLAYDQAQDAAATDRQKADEVIRRINLLLDFKLYHHDAPGIRRIKRNFGFTFKYLPGEPPDEDDPGTPESATPAPVSDTPAPEVPV